MQKRHYRFLLGLAVIGLLFSLSGPLTAQAAPSTYSDLKGHWAAGPINKWNDWGLVGGYSNGTFGVSRPVTRAEFIAFVNRAFGYTKTAEISFTDVKPNSWFAGDIAKAIGMEYMTGNADGTFRPNQPLSRLEAAQVLYKVMRLESIAEDYLAQFRDLANLTDADKAMINAVVAKGYFGGYPDKTIRAQSTITRAEMIAILSRAAGEIMNTASTFGPETGTVTLPGNATISKSGTTLRNTVVNGDLYITEGVGEGDFFLKNVKVLGRAIVAGGGSNSGHVEGDSQLAHLIITYPDGSTHVVFADQASAEQVEFRSSGDIDTSGSTSETRPTVTLSANIPAGSTVTAVGAFASVNVNAPGVTFAMAEGSVAENVLVNETATGTSVSIAGNVTGSVTVSAPQASTTIASTATVAAVTTTTTASSSAVTVQGTVTTITQNAPQATTTVATGATVSTVVTAPTATGGSITVRGTVSQVQANAPVALTVGTGGAVRDVALSSGAAGSSVTTEQGATKPAVTAPPEVTWQNNGQDTSGSSTGGGTSGGSTGGDTGGGTITPAITGFTVRDSNGQAITAGVTSTSSTIDLSGVSGDQVIRDIVISTNVTTSITVDRLEARGTTINNTNPATSTISLIDLVQGYLTTANSAYPSLGAHFDGTLKMGELRTLLGSTATVHGTVGGSSVQVAVTLGATDKRPVTTVNNLFAITLDGTSMQVGVRAGAMATKLSPNLGEAINAIRITTLSSALPTSVSFAGTPYSVLTELSGFKTALVADVNNGTGTKTWATLTLADLIPLDNAVSVTIDGVVYSVDFVAAP